MSFSWLWSCRVWSELINIQIVETPLVEDQFLREGICIKAVKTEVCATLHCKAVNIMVIRNTKYNRASKFWSPKYVFSICCKSNRNIEMCRYWHLVHVWPDNTVHSLSKQEADLNWITGYLTCASEQTFFEDKSVVTGTCWFLLGILLIFGWTHFALSCSFHSLILLNFPWANDVIQIMVTWKKIIVNSKIHQEND